MIDAENMPKLTITDFTSLSPRQVKDIAEPTLIVSELGPFGVRIAVVFPYHDYVERCFVMRKCLVAVSDLGILMGLSAPTETQG